MAQVDAAQGKLPYACGEQALGLADDIPGLPADGAPPGGGDDAICAAVGAAVLNLDHGPGPVVAGDAQGGERPLLPGAGQPGLVPLGDDLVHRIQGQDALPVGLHGAPRNHDARARGDGGKSAHQLGQVQNRPFGHGATVDEDQIGQGGVLRLHQPVGQKGFTEGLGLVLVDLASLRREKKKLPGLTTH